MPANPVWLSLLAQGAAASAGAGDCLAAPVAPPAVVSRTIPLRGTEPAQLEVPGSDTRLLVLVTERNIDVEVELRDSRRSVVARSESPVIRTGTSILEIDPRAGRTLAVRSKEHAGHEGSVEVTIRQASRAGACADLERRLAAADQRYATAHGVAQSLVQDGDTPVADIHRDAARRYEALLASPALAPARRGALELTLASIHYYDLSEWASSADWAARASVSLASAAQPYARARAQAIQAAAWLEMATSNTSGSTASGVPMDARTRFDTARKLLRELESFHLQRGEAYDAALQTNNIGLAYYYEARFPEAVPPYTAAMKVFEQLRETPRLALSLQNLALCDWGQGRLTAALPRFDRALDLMDSRAHPDLYLLTLNSSALAHYAAGKYDESLRLHARGLEYAQQVQNDLYRGRSLMGLGITYYALGDRRLSAQFLREALGILTAQLDARGRTTTLRSLATIEHDDGRYAAAAKYNLDALNSGVAASARARIKVRLAANHAALGDLVRARAELAPVIADPPGGDALLRAEAELELGRLLRAGGDHVAARAALDSALRGFESMQSVAGEFETRVELARLELALQREAQAIHALRQALALEDEIATQTGNPEYRASVVAALRPAQDLMVELKFARYRRAVAQGQAALAQSLAQEGLEFADNTRAQSFGQILAQRFADDDPRLAELLAARERLHRDLADRRYYLSTREDRRGPDDPLARQLRAEIASLRARLGVMNTELARHGRTTVANTGVEGPARLDFSRVPASRTWVEYWLGAEQAYAWRTSAGQVTWVPLGESNRIRSVARALHEGMRRLALQRTDTPAQRNDRRQAMERLHALIIAPLGSMRETDEMLIAADGPLHVVPFAALRASGADRYLVADHSIAFVPALRFAPTGADATPVRPAGGRLLLVDDPVYQPDDPRLQNVGTTATLAATARLLTRGSVDASRLPRLPSTAREAAAIRARFDAAQVELLEGLDATRQSLLDRDLAGFQYIHIASHGEMDAEIPQLSALILGRYGRQGPVADQKVWVDDLLARTFNAHVVVLSACDTSLGPEFAGEGPLGLRYAVLARGARSVVSSLWPVADEITADLMTEMYGELTNKANRTEMALTLAMRRLLQKRPTLDPALWAPYAAHVATPIHHSGKESEK